MLLLRTCDKDGRSYDGYQYPGVGEVAVAEDWDPTPECGGGLHGLPNGQGYGGLLDWDDRALWQVLDTEDAPVVELDDKAKCRSAREVYRGDRAGALMYLRDHGVMDPLPGEVVTAGDWCEVAVGFGGEATAGDHGRATAGEDGHATAGDWGTATAGYNGHATTGDDGHATAGAYGAAKAGDHGQATTGHNGKATAGCGGKATAGDRGHATVADEGQATAGEGGHAEAGYCGQATVGEGGQARAGWGSMIMIAWWDESNKRHRQAVGYVGEDGIEPDTWYHCDEDGHLVAVEEEEDAAAEDV